MPEPILSHLQAVVHNDVLVLTIIPPEVFADEVADGLRADLHAALTHFPQSRIALDFRNVRFITTIAFQPLLSVRRKVHAAGRHIVLCGLQPNVAEVFEVTRLIATKPEMLAAFDHERDLPAAIARLQQMG